MERVTTFALTWRQQDWGSGPVDRWYVYGPPPSDACGGVWRERGLWRAEVWPHGRRVLGAYYHRREQAMRHIERWLRAHPGTVKPGYDPRGFKGRDWRRPDHLLQEYLRNH